MPKNKKCTICERRRLLKFFYLPSRGFNVRPQCKECLSKACKGWREDNKQKSREYKLKRRYGIDLEDYNRLLKQQKGKCAICKEVPKKDHLCVDHNHKTLAVRGLLCNNCNTALGMFQDDPLLIKRAADYLKAHKRKKT